ncbi:MAG: M23 family metallopeptidase [Gemmatimonadetes bacterium]|nr:M23 family metallopeptidase [Gemmatimonadota bacterium]
MRFATSTPRETYEARLRELGLHTTALGRDWAAAAERALGAPVSVVLPHHEVRYLDPRQAAAVAYRLSLERGQRVAARIEVADTQPSDLTFFLDLFFLPDSVTPPQPVASADSSAWEFEYVAMRPGDYVLRLQPELLRGGRITLTVSAHASLEFPVAGMDLGTLRSRFGAPRDAGRREHHGVDLFAPRGTAVLAAAAGWVSWVGTNRLGGNVVWLRDARYGRRLYYAHLDRHAVEEDRWVEPGDTLGFVGNTGNARTTRPHLHFGIYIRGEGPVDPYFHLLEPTGRLPLFAGDSSLVGGWGRVTSSGGRLRARAEGSAPPIVALPGDAPVQVLAGVGPWYLARLPSGKEGYVSLREVRPLQPLYSAAVAAGSVLRSAPGTLGAATESLARGEVVPVLGRYGNQVLVRHPSGLLGWMGSESLVVSGGGVAGVQ